MKTSAEQDSDSNEIEEQSPAQRKRGRLCGRHVEGQSTSFGDENERTNPFTGKDGKHIDSCTRSYKICKAVCFKHLGCLQASRGCDDGQLDCNIYNCRSNQVQSIRSTV